MWGGQPEKAQGLHPKQEKRENTSSENGSEARKRTRTKNFSSSPLFSSPTPLFFLPQTVPGHVLVKVLVVAALFVCDNQGEKPGNSLLFRFSAHLLFSNFFMRKNFIQNFTCPCLAGPVSPIYRREKCQFFGRPPLSLLFFLVSVSLSLPPVSTCQFISIGALSLFPSFCFQAFLLPSFKVSRVDALKTRLFRRGKFSHIFACHPHFQKDIIGGLNFISSREGKLDSITFMKVVSFRSLFIVNFFYRRE